MMKKVLQSVLWAILSLFLVAYPALAGTAQYTYDSLNRLVQVQYEDGTVIQYTYDAAGNRLVKQVIPPPPPGP
jgi:YD repeat-containing protein